MHGTPTFRGGKVAEVAPSIESAQAAETIAADGALVVPGLIDLHTHVYWGVTYWWIEPDPIAARSGVTTWLGSTVGSLRSSADSSATYFVPTASPLSV